MPLRTTIAALLPHPVKSAPGLQRRVSKLTRATGWQSSCRSLPPTPTNDTTLRNRPPCEDWQLFVWRVGKPTARQESSGLQICVDRAGWRDGGAVRQLCQGMSDGWYPCGPPLSPAAIARRDTAVMSQPGYRATSARFSRWRGFLRSGPQSRSKARSPGLECASGALSTVRTAARTITHPHRSGAQQARRSNLDGPARPARNHSA
jgi:hypothetical protein